MSVKCHERTSATQAEAGNELADVEPFKTVLSGDSEVMSRAELDDVPALAGEVLAGKTRGLVVIDLLKPISAVRLPACQCTSAPPPQLFLVEY